MDESHARIDEIKAGIKKNLPKAISEKLLEFNTKFQELGSKPEEEKRHEEEQKMFEEAKKGMKKVEVVEEADKVKDASAWNAKAYHWEEKDVSERANSRLKELIKNIHLEIEGEKISVTEIKSFNGDVKVKVKL